MFNYIDYGNPVSDHPLNYKLASWWLPLPNNSGGSRLFDLKGANTGTLTNGPTWASGPNGFGALSFDGTDDYVSVPAGMIGGLPNIAVSVFCWMYPLAVTGYRVLFDAGPNGETRYLSAFMGSATTLFVAVAGDAGVEPTLSESWVANEWQHVGLTCDGTTIRIYRNGREVGSSSASWGIGAGFAAAEWRIGGNPSGGGQAFSGQQGDVTVYGRVVSASEVAALYDQSRRGYPDLFRRWKRRLYTFGTVAGGGPQTIDPTGSVTPSGSSVDQVTKGVSGSVTTTGSLAKEADKSAAGSSTAAGSLTHTAQKSAVGSSAASGSVTNAVSQVLAGSSTAAAVLVKAVTQALARSSTPTGSLANLKVSLASYSGSCSPSGSLTHQVAVGLASSSTAAGSLAKASFKVVAGTSTAVGSLAKVLAKAAYTGSAAPSGALTNDQITAGLSTDGSVTPSSTLTMAVSKSLSGRSLPYGLLYGSENGGASTLLDQNVGGTLLLLGV